MYQRTGMETLSLPPAAFEFDYSALAFHYAEDFGRSRRTVAQALVPGANSVFSIEHPMFMVPTAPGWVEGPDGRPSWRLNGYSQEEGRVTNWCRKPTGR